MADIKVLMVADGARFNFGPQQNPAAPEDDSYFGISQLYTALRSSTTPTIQVDFAHRRGHAFAGKTLAHEDCSANLTYAGDFVFVQTTPPAPNTVTADLGTYDVLWLIGDEGYNGGGLALTDTEITDPEKIAIANFMAGGGGVFAVGDHDGIGALMCGKLPRVRTMRRWFEWDHPEVDAASGQAFTPNWNVVGLSAGAPNQTDRNDTLRPDSADGLFYFFDQSDPTPQPLLDASQVPLATSAGEVHTILRDAVGAVIGQFPDHMHEGEATDLASVASPPFNPNQGPNQPWSVTYQDANHLPVSFVEFPMVPGYQPLPEVIAYTSDLGHVTDGGAKTNAKGRGAVSIYDGHAVGVGRVATGSTFHHYLDKNLLGDPGTASANPAVGPTGSNLGLPSTVVASMSAYYVNIVTWLAPLSRNFSFLTTKNTFGADEVTEVVSQGKAFDNAFYLALDGYAPSVVGAMPNVVLSGPFNTIGAVFQQNASIPEDAGSPNTPQRILIPFTVISIPTGPSPPSAFPAPGAAPLVLVLEARLTLNGAVLAAEALFELVAGADPYFSNLGPGAGDQWYLSQDLKVFQAGPGAPSTPFVSYPFLGTGYQYMTSLLAYLNNPANGYTSGAADPMPQLSQNNDLIEASSVTPNAASFAIARVRLRGTAGTPASGVKVFFRLWTTSSNDTDFDAQATYVSTYDGAALPDRPLASPSGLNWPLFASGQSGAGDYDPGVNQQDITVLGAGQTWRYFGCYLDVYNNPSISLIGAHHCLVAQIAYDGAPIVGATGITLSPENSDKLAQRNIEITSSGNPGGPDAHRVPQTFDLRPSRRTGVPIGSLTGHADELWIDWGNVPQGTVAHIYWPQANAIDVVRLAARLYNTDLLQVEDAHTVRCTVRSGLTYVPIPFGSGGNFAGLFTLDLPLGVRRGQRFQVVVRRISTRQILNAQRERAPVAVAAAAGGPISRDWRYVVGTFQVTIPVGLEEGLLLPEENTLAILKWRLQNLPPSSRWYPVMVRYVAYVSARVNAFGGNAGSVLPSPTGVPALECPPCGKAGFEFTGKVCEVIFDCFGDFEGFVLESCSDHRRFSCRERAIGELVLKASRERLVISVVVDRELKQRIRQVIVRS